MGKKKNHAFDYKAALKEIRGITNLKYDLRKKLTPGQKGAIHRAYNAAARARRIGLTIEPVRRLAGESKTHYKKRLRAMRNATETPRGISTGIVLQVPPGGKAQLKKDGTIGFTFSGKLKNRKEWFFRFPSDMWLANDKEQLRANVESVVLPLIKRYKPTLLQLAHGPYRGISYGMNPLDYNTPYGVLIEDALDLLTDELSDRAMEYKQKGNESAYSGLYLIRE